MARWSILTLLTFVLVFCISELGPLKARSEDPPRPVYEDPDGYAVLSVLLDRYHFGSKTAVILISPFTVSEGRMLSSLNCGKVPQGFQTVAKDFHDKNKIAFQLEAKFSMDGKYELSDSARKVLPPPKSGEQELLSRVYMPVYFVSAVGFDSLRTHAIAYVGAICGGECGGGGYYFLTKDTKGWREVPGSPACTWISRSQFVSNSQAPA